MQFAPVMGYIIRTYTLVLTIQVLTVVAENSQHDLSPGLCSWGDVQRKGWVWNYVDLSGCTALHFAGSLSDDDVVAFARGFEQHHEITTLDLAGNNIGVTGATALAAMLKHNYYLTTLKLSDNLIGDEGISAIAGSMLREGMVTSLWRSFYDGGLQRYWEARTYNRVLTTLDLSRNDISDRAIEPLADLLWFGSQLTSLLLNGNNISETGASALATAVTQSGTKTVIEVNKNDTRTITYLHGTTNDSTSSATEDLDPADCACAELQAIELSATKVQLEVVQGQLNSVKDQLKVAEAAAAATPFAPIVLIALTCCILYPLARWAGSGNARLLEEAKGREDELQQRLTALEERLSSPEKSRGGA